MSIDAVEKVEKFQRREIGVGHVLVGRRWMRFQNKKGDAPWLLTLSDKMTIREDKAQEKVEYEGKTYWFCVAGYRERFINDPGKYSVEDRENWLRGE